MFLHKKRKMKHLYGPVVSRRLGLSLGVSLTPHKTCDFDCLYCQLGKTTNKTRERRTYIAVGEIFDELRTWFQENASQAAQLAFVTLSGCGEPTLHTEFGTLIQRIKENFAVKVAVITNASYLNDRFVRSAIINADLIVPSLDAATQAVFERIDRPVPGLCIEGVIDGIVSLRNEFKGTLWLEVMLVKGVNDDIRHIRRLKEAIEKINPDKIQLNSPVRSTAEPGILPVGKNKLEKIREMLGEKCEIL